MACRWDLAHRLSEFNVPLKHWPGSQSVHAAGLAEGLADQSLALVADGEVGCEWLQAVKPAQDPER
jgi:hypothetical protein